MLSLKYRNREEVTFIYSHKTFSLRNNDSLMFGCILSSQDSASLMQQMGQQISSYLHVCIFSCAPTCGSSDTSSNMTFSLPPPVLTAHLITNRKTMSFFFTFLPFDTKCQHNTLGNYIESFKIKDSLTIFKTKTRINEFDCALQ